MRSRRDVLKTIVLGSGAVFLSPYLGCRRHVRSSEAHVNSAAPKSSPFHRHAQNFRTPHEYLRDGRIAEISESSTTLRTQVVVIGGGPSGLSAAYALMKQGHDVVLLENEDRAGGAAVFSSYRGLRFPLASIYFVDANPMIRELCDYAGVKPVPAPEDALVLGQQYFYDYWQDSVLSTLPIAASDRDAMKRFRDDMLKIDDVPPYPLPRTLNSRLAALDRMSAREFCAGYKSEFLSSFIELYTRSSMGARLDNTNAYSLLNFYTGEIAKNPQTKRQSFDGGLGGLSEKLSSRFSQESLLLSHCATRVRNSNGGVEVDAVHGDKSLRIKADAVIVATQKYMLPRMIESLPEDQVTAIRSFRYTPMLTVHLCSDQAIMPNKGFDTWYPEAGELFTDIIDPKTIGAAVDGEAFVASVYAPLGVESRAQLLDESFVVDYAHKVALKALELMGQEDRDKVKEIYTFAWGHSMVQAQPGSHSGPAQRASRPFGNIYFANTDNTCVSAFENAIAEGFRAAESVHRQLKRSTGAKRLETRR